MTLRFHHVARRAVRRSWIAVIVTALAACGDSGVPLSAADPTDSPPSGSVRLAQAHAHNDYEHDTPLFDALSHGFASVEADVWTYPGLGDHLYVAHDFVDIRRERTLDALYLAPLAQRIADNGGWVYAGEAESLQLLVDFKTAADTTYAALEAQLEPYRNILTCLVDGEWRQGAVTIVISGNRPYETMAAQRDRCAFYDGRSSDLDGDDPAALMPLVSDNWGALFSWNGEGEMPEDERMALQAFVAAAHATGKRVRFWATPDDEGAARMAVWQVLLEADVDHLNTDDLAGLEAFLRAQDGG